MQSGFWWGKCFNKDCSVFKTFKFNCFFNFFVMEDFWEQLWKRMRFSVLIEFYIPPRKRLKLVQFAKGYFFDEWSIKRVVELELLPDSLLSSEFLISFWGTWFSLALSFLTGLILDSQTDIWCFLLQAKQRCCEVQF